MFIELSVWLHRMLFTWQNLVENRTNVADRKVMGYIDDCMSIFFFVSLMNGLDRIMIWVRSEICPIKTDNLVIN